MRRGVAGSAAVMAGFAVMSLELTAVRILAPRFGDSAYVWTNVIGVMLMALAGGAWLGGRLADARHGPKRLAWMFGVAGLLTAVVPLVATPIGGLLLPSHLPLDSAMGALVSGSLVATLVLFAPPVTLVGGMTPMLVVSLVHGGSRIGQASGMVAAASTVGSLLGTFATTHWLVPEFGSRATVWLCAALLLGCAVLVRPSALGVGAIAVPLCLLPWSWGPLREVSAGQELLAEVESSYQYLQVVRENVEGRPTVSLRINEGLDSFHSVTIEGTAYTGGRYYDYHALVPYLVGDGRVPRDLRVLSLGAAAGTFSRLFAAAHPGATVDGVEIDPAVVDLGERYFGGRPASGVIMAGLDARVSADHGSTLYDVVLVDTYERQIYVPAHVASREFFEAVRLRLKSGGAVSVNAGGRTFDDPVVQAIARTMAAVFGETHAFRIPRSRNFMLLARRDGKIDPAVLDNVVHADKEMLAVLDDARFSGAWHRVKPGEPVLSDDQPLLDVLQERALVRQVGFDGVTPMTGSVDPAAAGATARERLYDDRSFASALDALQSASAATPELRVLAGEARWLLHDLPGAEAEYEAARALEPEGPMGEFAEQRLTAVREQLRGLSEAVAASRTNGWLAAAAALVWAAALAFVGWRTR